MQLSLYDLWLSMGLFAKGIVVVMAIMSLFSWTQAFQKWWQIWRSQQETKKFAPEFSRFLQEEQLDGAIKLAEKQKRSHVAVRGPARHRDGDRECVHRHGGLGRRRLARVGVGRHRRSAHHDGVRAHGGDPGGVAVQLLHDKDRLPLRRDDLYLEGADRLPDQERRVGVRPVDLHEGIPDAEGVTDQWPCQPLAPAPRRPSRRTSTSRR